jgi:hypothetical protein
MTVEHPISYELGRHTLEVAEEAAFTIGNERLTVQLEPEEAYRLHLVLVDLFQHMGDPTMKTER